MEAEIQVQTAGLDEPLNSTKTPPIAQIETQPVKNAAMDSNQNEKLSETPSKNASKELIFDARFPTFNGRDVKELTKSQMKKYKKMLQWEAQKAEKRLKQRLHAKIKKKEAKLKNIDLGPSRKQLKQSKMSTSSCSIGVVIDLSFDDLMIPKDLGKVIKQILRVYTENRRAKAPMQLHLTSFGGKNKQEMAKHTGHENWDIYFHEENYLDLFPKEKLVYLTSESENVIQDLAHDKIYIIGGLVDHNSHKGICYKKAVEQGISHGQLPVSEYCTTTLKKVFTINQVFEILLRVSEGDNFKEAFSKALPQRIITLDCSRADEEDDEDD